MSIDIEAIRQAVADGWVRVQKHPAADLFIYNYADRCQWEKHWTPATMACRGLILDGAGNIVARPFAKFFNYEEVKDRLPAEPFEVFDKLDGSLGILYPGPDGPAIATRGSFISEQAIEATKMLREQFDGIDASAMQSSTALFEIIYPENRIVVDYGARRELVLLTVIDNATGEELPYEWLRTTMPCPIVERFDGMKDFDAVLAHNADNCEGFVIRFASGFRCKVKLADYVRLHKLLTGLTPRGVWEHLKGGGFIDDLADRVPDEFHAWLREQASTLRAEFAAIEAEARDAVPNANHYANRREAAEIIKRGRYPAVSFAMLDGKPFDAAIWRLIRPHAARAFRCDSDVVSADTLSALDV